VSLDKTSRIASIHYDNTNTQPKAIEVIQHGVFIYTFSIVELYVVICIKIEVYKSHRRCPDSKANTAEANALCFERSKGVTLAWWTCFRMPVKVAPCYCVIKMASYFDVTANLESQNTVTSSTTASRLQRANNSSPRQ
jgi:hypothetical protein